MLGRMAEQPPRDPQRLDGVVQAALVRVSHRDSADATGVPQRRRRRLGPQFDALGRDVQQEDARCMVQLIR